VLIVIFFAAFWQDRRHARNHLAGHDESQISDQNYNWPFLEDSLGGGGTQNSPDYSVGPVRDENHINSSRFSTGSNGANGSNVKLSKIK
jgi:hypothetical protein